MDARHAARVPVSQDAHREIPRSAWVAAPPSGVLNAALALGWMTFLWSIGLFSVSDAESAETALSFPDQLALAFFMATLVGIVAVVGAALSNSSRTASISAICALAMIALGATCGFAGHPISAWGPDTASAAVLGFASLAIMGRRQA